MNIFSHPASTLDCRSRFEAILVIIEAKSDQTKKLDQELVDRSRAAVVVIDCRDKSKRMTYHHEKVGSLRPRVLEANDRKFPMIRSDCHLPIGLPLVQYPTSKTFVGLDATESSEGRLTLESVEGNCSFSVITVTWLIMFVVALSHPLTLFF